MKGSNYRVIRGHPYGRREYIKGNPALKIAKFHTGEKSNNYEIKLQLAVKFRAQIRHNAIEAARVSANKILNQIGPDVYYLSVVAYPHIVLKENKMIDTAGADRLQEGMRRAFGKPTGLAARAEIGTTILEVRIMKEHLSEAKRAFKTASSKLPIQCFIREIELKN